MRRTAGSCLFIPWWGRTPEQKRARSRPSSRSQILCRRCGAVIVNLFVWRVRVLVTQRSLGASVWPSCTANDSPTSTSPALPSWFHDRVLERPSRSFSRVGRRQQPGPRGRRDELASSGASGWRSRCTARLSRTGFLATGVHKHLSSWPARSVTPEMRKQPSTCCDTLRRKQWPELRARRSSRWHSTTLVNLVLLSASHSKHSRRRCRSTAARSRPTLTSSRRTRLPVERSLLVRIQVASGPRSRPVLSPGSAPRSTAPDERLGPDALYADAMSTRTQLEPGRDVRWRQMASWEIHHCGSPGKLRRNHAAICSGAPDESKTP